MKKNWALVIGVMVAAIVQGNPNPIEGGSAVVVSDQWDVQSPWLMVGSNSGSNSMRISAGGKVNNQIGILGNTQSSAENTVWVLGNDSLWNNEYELTVGNLGASNELIVAGGGMAYAPTIHIGKSSDGNVAFTTALNSRLIAEDLYVGYKGDHNLLVGAFGGGIESDNASIGYWLESDNNLALLHPEGTWTNNGVINVGEYGSGNALSMSERSIVSSSMMNVGVHVTSTNNAVSVAGEGSLLDTTALNIGGTANNAGGAGNRVEVSGGGAVYTKSLTIHGGNDFDLNDGGTLAVDNDFDASMDGFNFNSGGTLEVGGELTGMGGYIDEQRSLIINGSNALWNAGSSYVAVGGIVGGNKLVAEDGAQLTTGAAAVGLGKNADTNLVIVRGAGSVWTNKDGITIGYSGADNTVKIEDGGKLFNSDLVLGHRPSSGRNELAVSGKESLLTNSSYLVVGFSSKDNVMKVSDGGTVFCSSAVIGSDVDADHNSAIVSGPGSAWNIAGNIDIGEYGKNCSLIVTNGGLVTSQSAIMGQFSKSAESHVLISGEGSVWSNRESLVVGQYGDRHSIEISDGGVLYNAEATLGVNGGYVEVAVTGNGSVWSNRGNVVIGHSGDYNEVMVFDGGSIYASNTYLGYNANEYRGNIYSSDGNSLAIDGEGSLYSLSEDLFVGYQGRDNQLEVSGGGYVADRNGYVGYGIHAVSNSVVVSGKNAIWHNREGLYLGGHKSGADWIAGGAGNSLTVRNGGLVLVGDVDIDNLSSIDTGLVVGDESGNAELVVANGSSVSGGEQGFLGNVVLGVNSNWAGRITVQDSGSIIDEVKQLYVGYDGSGSILTVKNQGRVNSGTGYIGYGESAAGNRVLVSGSNSVWAVNSSYGSYYYRSPISGGTTYYVEPVSSYQPINALYTDPVGNYAGLTEGGDLFVGYAGHANGMVVSNGAAVFSEGGTVGYKATADNNTALLSHGLWYMEDQLVVGHEGSGNLLHADDGSWVVSQGLVIGSETNANGNAVSISGEGTILDSTWYAIGGFGSARIPVESSNSIPAVSWMAPDFSTYIGKEGSYNDLAIMNGAHMISADVCIGNGADASDNGAYISGGGSVWTNYGAMFAGHSGDRNTLTIRDGAKVLTSHGAVIGGSEGADDNLVVVSGDDARWELAVNPPDFSSSITGTNYYRPVTGDDDVIYVDRAAVPHLNDALVVGYMGSSNALMISDGGTVFGDRSFIGLDKLSRGNRALVSGTTSSWYNSDDLHVGYAGSMNSLLVEDGAQVVAQGGVTIGYGEKADYNSVTVSGEHSLLSDGSIQYARLQPVHPPLLITNFPPLIINTNFVRVPTGGDGGNVVAISEGAFVVYSSTNVVEIASPESGWVVPNTNFYVVEPVMHMLRYGEMVVGRDGSCNTLNIEDGGLVASMWASVGESTNAWHNRVAVSGTNSTWDIHHDLSLGGRMSSLYWMVDGEWQNGWVDGGRYNSLYVGQGGNVKVGRNFHNRNYSSLTIDPGAQVSIGSNYVQDATSTLRFGVSTDASGAPETALMRVGGTASFEKGAKIDYAYNVTDLQFDRFYTNCLIQAGTLEVDGVSDANALDLQKLDSSGSLVDVILWENNQDIYALAGRRWLADSAGFGSNTMLRALSGQIDMMSLLGDEDAVRMINFLNGMSGSVQAAQITQQYQTGTANHLHTRGMTEGMEMVRSRTSRRQSPQASAPAGAAGPYRKDQGLQGWVKPYGVWAEYDGADGFSGYGHSIYGTVAGVDFPLDSALLGLAGGYGRSVIDQDNGDFSEAKTGFGMLYLNWGTENWFSHANLAYGMGQVEQRSGSVFGNEADFDANSFGAFWGGGREFRFGKRFILTPEISMLWSHYMQDEYTESSDFGVPRQVAAYEHDSFLASVGGSFAVQQEYEIMIVKPEVRMSLKHEFNSDVDSMEYELSDGSRYHYRMPATEENVLEAGCGISCLFHDELELVFDLDGRIGEDYSAYALSGRAVFEF